MGVRDGYLKFLILKYFYLHPNLLFALHNHDYTNEGLCIPLSRGHTTWLGLLSLEQFSIISTLKRKYNQRNTFGMAPPLFFVIVHSIK